jgi:regulatory protein
MVKVRKLIQNSQGYSVTFQLSDDSEASFATTADLVVEYRLVPGKILEDFAFLSFQKAQKTDEIYHKAASYGARYPKTRFEMAEYLRQKSCLESDLESILDRLEKGHILDDSAYVSLYLADHADNRHEGPVKIQFDLKSKGVPLTLIQAGLGQYSTKDWQASMNRLFDKKLSSLARRPLKKALSDMMRHLIDKGYDPEAAHTFVGARSGLFLEGRDEEAQLQKEFAKLRKRLHIEGNPNRDQTEKMLRQLMNKGYSYPQIKKQLERGQSDETEDVGI